MCGTDKIIQYLREKYRPESIIVYGSFADGSAGENSDFDALVIADCECAHDASVMEGTVLDVFVYPPETFLAAYDPEEFVQTFDGEILLDERGIAAQLKSRVCDYIAQYPQKTEQEIFQEIAWCEKMFLRTKRGDTEGYYRWHWLLTDSLSIYCDVKHRYYFGPKKTLRYMSQTDEEAYRIYSLALKELCEDRLSEWIACLKRML